MKHKKLWVIGPRNAWDQVIIGPYASREAALRDKDVNSSDSIVREATPEEAAAHYNNESIKNKLI